MSSVNLGPGIVFDGVDGHEVSPARLRSRRSFRNAFVGDEFTPEIDAALREMNFSIDADSVISPERGGARRRSRRPASALPPVVKVSVKPDEGAVLLIQSAEGVFHWQFPTDKKKFGSRRKGGESDTLTFALTRPINVAPARRRGKRGIGDALGWVADKLIEPIRVRVLRYAAAKTIEYAIEKIEGHLTPGLVWLNGSEGQWDVTQATPPAPEPGRKVLLLVHGTFSTTVGSFAALAREEGDVGSFLEEARANYDLVLGFDHKTLALDPMQNAEQIYDALDFLPDGTRLDAIAYSRGGLVYRALSEKLAVKKGSRLHFDRAVFVGCTNSGTHLAEPDNWEDLVGLYTNIGLAGARALDLLGSPVAGRVAAEAIKLLGGFVQALPELAIKEDRVPGLAAMEPDGDFIKTVNEGVSPTERYRAIISNFEPRPGASNGISGGLAGYLADRVMDRLMDRDNDLVVDTASMTNFGSDKVLAKANVRRFVAADAVYHTIYFQSHPVPAWLAAWLFEYEEAEAEEDASGDDDEMEDCSPDGYSTSPSKRRSGGHGRSPASPSRFNLEDPDSVDDHGAPSRASIGERPNSAGAPPAKPNEYYFSAEMSATPQVGVAPMTVTISEERIRVAMHSAAAAADRPRQATPNEAIIVTAMAMDNCHLWSGQTDMTHTDNGSSAQIEVMPPDGSLNLRFLIEGVRPGHARVQVQIEQGTKTLASFSLEPFFIDFDVPRLSKSYVGRQMEPSDEYPVVLKIFEQNVPGTGLVLKYDLVSIDPPFVVKEEVTLPETFSIAQFSKEVIETFNEYDDLSEGEYQTALRNMSTFSVNRTKELLPQRVRECLASNWDRVRAVQVFSENAHMPWELLSIRKQGAPRDQASFLSERGLVRWVYNAHLPGITLPIREGKARHVIPDYRESSHKLDYAATEKGMFERIFEGAKSAGTTSLDVSRFLETEADDCDLLHFACHGDTAHNSVLSADLYMEGFERSDGYVGEDPISVDTVQDYASFAEGPVPRTMVFVNACRAGAGGKSIRGTTGFAEAFLRPNSGPGAACFIGALWEVNDAYAYEFSEEFYKAMKVDGDPLVTAAQRARETLKSKATDFTWLAYTIYGNPLAKFVFE